MLIIDVPRMSNYTKDAFKFKTIEQLNELSHYDVAEVWATICHFGYHDFEHLLRAMKTQRVVFRDVDPGKVDLLANDIKKLRLTPRTTNALAHCEVVSFAMLERLTAQKLLAEVRNFGGKALGELQAALVKAGISLAEN